MNNFKTKAGKLSLAVAGLVLAASANAATWTTPSFTVDSVNNVGTLVLGDFTYNFTDFGGLSVGYYDGNLKQGVDKISGALQSSGLFGLTSTSVLKLVGSADSISGNSLTITPPPAFDNLAVHIGGGELLFHWNTLNTSPFSITTSAPVDPKTGFSNLSNYRAFTSAVPEPETYGMLLAGLGLVGFLARRRKAA